MVRPVLEGFPDAHLWSIGATEGTQSIRLDTLDEGQTRLLACTPASPSRPGASRQHLAASGSLAADTASVQPERTPYDRSREGPSH